MIRNQPFLSKVQRSLQSQRSLKSLANSVALALLLFCLAPLLGQKKETPSPSRPQPKSGDIVFQDSEVDGEGHKHSGQAGPIKELTKSDWSHMGIYFEKPGGAVVVEAIGRAHKEIPWSEWRGHGAGGNYAVRRLKGGLDAPAAKALYQAATKYAGKPYDFKFAWNDDEIYCSELVWKAFRDACHKKVGQVQRLGDFALSSPAGTKLIERPVSWGSIEKVPLEEKVVSPQAILSSPELDEVK
jgi:hypothetical protein